MPVRSPYRKTLTVAAAFLVFAPGSGLCSTEPPPSSGAPGTSSPTATAPSPTGAAPAPAATEASAAGAPRAGSAAGAGNAATELPTFRFGLWEYRRTVVRAGATKPQVSTVKKCVDPGADMREKMESLKKKGCQFAPLRHNGDRYISSWVCQTPTGAMRFRDVLLVKDPDSYEDVSETHTRQHVSQQKIEAVRVGECPGMGSGAPLTPTPKPPRRHP
jgi:Protein of unknown function (DUF3617)